MKQISTEKFADAIETLAYVHKLSEELMNSNVAIVYKDLPVAYSHLGINQGNAGDHEKASSSFEKALEFDPENQDIK